MDIYDLLARTSRSFSLGIMGLEGPLKEYVCLGYLVCRLMDTYEDTTSLPPSLRVSCLAYAESLMSSLPELSDDFENRLSEWDQVHSFDQVWTAERHPDSSEYELLRHGAEIWALLRKMPQQTRFSFRSSLLEMAVGMRQEVATRQIELRLEPRTPDETDVYCYIVAGTVGRLLTLLFQEEGAFPKFSGDSQLDQEAIEFGKALQLVNIMKDFHKDWLEGRCYWPGLALPKGPGLTPPSEEHLLASFAVLRGLFARYRVSAEAYTERMRQSRRDLHFFCAFPLRMAIATLEEADQNKDWLSSGGTFKVSRTHVTRILTELSGD